MVILPINFSSRQKKNFFTSFKKETCQGQCHLSQEHGLTPHKGISTSYSYAQIYNYNLFSVPRQGHKVVKTFAFA